MSSPTFAPPATAKERIPAIVSLLCILRRELDGDTFTGRWYAEDGPHGWTLNAEGHDPEEPLWLADFGRGGEAFAQFCAQARTDVPLLLDEISRLRSEIANLHSRSEQATCNAQMDGETIAVLQEALEFYVPIPGERVTTVDIAHPCGLPGVRLTIDSGQRARAALARCQGEEVPHA